MVAFIFLLGQLFGLSRCKIWVTTKHYPLYGHATFHVTFRSFPHLFSSNMLTHGHVYFW